MMIRFLGIISCLIFFSCVSKGEYDALAKEKSALEENLSETQNTLDKLESELKSLKDSLSLTETNSLTIENKNSEYSKEIEKLLEELAPFRAEKAAKDAIEQARLKAIADAEEAKKLREKELKERPIIPIKLASLTPEQRPLSLGKRNIGGTALTLETFATHKSVYSSLINYKSSNIWLEAKMVGDSISLELFISYTHSKKEDFTRELELKILDKNLSKAQKYEVWQVGNQYREIWSWTILGIDVENLFEVAKSTKSLSISHPGTQALAFPTNWVDLETETALSPFDIVIKGL